MKSEKEGITIKKEALTIQGVIRDLRVAVNTRLGNAADWRFSYIIPATLLALFIGVYFKIVWLAVLFSLFAVYHLVFFIIEYRKHRARKREIAEIFEREDISISVEKLERIDHDTIYEPHSGFKRVKALKTVKVYCFASGIRWRVPDVDKHYTWSADYCLSTKGLDNLSLVGDEFYFISVQGDFEISYIYPRKIFELGGDIKNSIQDNI